MGWMVDSPYFGLRALLLINYQEFLHIIYSNNKEKEEQLFLILKITTNIHLMLLLNKNAQQHNLINVLNT